MHCLYGKCSLKAKGKKVSQFITTIVHNATALKMLKQKSKTNIFSHSQLVLMSFFCKKQMIKWSQMPLSPKHMSQDRIINLLLAMLAVTPVFF